jgi:hypothetical protein
LIPDCVRIDLEMELLAEVARIAWDEARRPKSQGHHQQLFSEPSSRRLWLPSPVAFPPKALGFGQHEVERSVVQAGEGAKRLGPFEDSLADRLRDFLRK